ncbi:MAG: class II D-tagatose-bisphosphate aldolase, non-catalytic subunit [Anaerolineales bacterium]
MQNIDDERLILSSIKPIRERISKHKAGSPVGLISVCSSHPEVIRSALKFSRDENCFLLIESTCNQVNQFGGYTGQTPAEFVAKLKRELSGFSGQVPSIALGGDHLGPYPWRSQPAAEAMGHASKLVEDYVSAGYRKIHLDASMRCVDDPEGPLDVQVSAQRAAELCRAAEQASERTGLECVYVIGSEVPTPGGDQEGAQAMQVTSVEDLRDTIRETRKAFYGQGLESAWERVIAVVVQPGVEFSDQSVHDYRPSQSEALPRFIEGDTGLVYEAHSTDYQTPGALKNLVRDHFMILKVGPELTFQYREAVFALERIEKELSEYRSNMKISRVSEVIEGEMLRDPGYWEDYYHGDEGYLSFARKYSLSDRVRYYWSRDSVQDALDQLMENLTSVEVPLGLVSQYLPRQYRKVREGELRRHPEAWIEDKIASVLEKYLRAASLDA